MGRVLINLILLAALIFTIALGWLRSDPTRTNVEFMPDMAHSPRYNAFAPNPNFANGSTLQSPEPGTIARGHMPLHYAATPHDALRAGEELQNPDPRNNQRALQRGEFVFTNFCTPCHGSGGTGDGLVAQRGFPPPPSLLAPHAVTMKDGQMFHVLTYGQNNMPSYASQLSRQDRWDVIVYIRSLQTAAPPPATTQQSATQKAAGAQP